MPGTRRAAAQLIAQEDTMNTTKIVGTLLIVAGTLGLIYGGFSYTREKHDVKLGSLQFSLAEKDTVYIPVWAGAGAIGVGAILLLMRRKP
jgi:hypothetical protein